MLLNTLASRVNAMRKEVVKTEMRIRIKNKLLDCLSLCGDQIFPKRKDLIKEISQTFMSDIDHFIASHFEDEEFQRVPLYALREEIKQLQSIAKVLTLNTHAFTETRLKLSGCWINSRAWKKSAKKKRCKNGKYTNKITISSWKKYTLLLLFAWKEFLSTNAIKSLMKSSIS